VIGTYLHGLFENDAFRRTFITRVATRHGRPVPHADRHHSVERTIDQLADLVRDHLDLDPIRAAMQLPVLSSRA